MPSLKAIRRRIGSVKSTQKITKAMKMVAAAKLRRAQMAIVEARPYAGQLLSLLSELAARVGGDAPHPLLERRPERRVMLVVMSSDRGLCGAFNSGLLRRAEREVAEWKRRDVEARIVVIGRKGRDYLARRKYDIKDEFLAIQQGLNFGKAIEIANGIMHDYTEGSFDAVYLLYNEFRSAISQRVCVERLLPIEPLAEIANPVDFLYEPGRDELLAYVLPKYVTSQVWRSLLESVASELGARMSAMDSATTNAGEVINKLSLSYNRARQASITKELMEIVSGAEALRG